MLIHERCGTRAVAIKKPPSGGPFDLLDEPETVMGYRCEAGCRWYLGEKPVEVDDN